MGYLGLDQTEVKDDNMFQRLFWPSDHAGETDTLGKQGFWVCQVVAGFSGLVLLTQGHWLLALFTMLFFALGGIGVREHSTAAAALVAVTYLLNLVANAFVGMPPGIVTLGTLVLLLANIRGTWIASKWARNPDPETMPERRKETLADRLVDQMPPRVWPYARIPFFVLSGIYLMLTAVGTFMLATRVQATPVQPSITVQAPPR